MGDDDIRQAAETSNRLLKSPVKALQEGGLSEGSKVGNTLLELRRTVEDLDPKRGHRRQEAPRHDPVRRQGHRLLPQVPVAPRATSTASCTPCATARTSWARTTPRSTWRSSTSGTRWAGSTSTSTSPSGSTPGSPPRIAELEATDPERAKALRDDVLFYVRQKHQDLLTQLAVSIQNYLAIDIVIKNNIELIKGVDRASTTTVSALRTAVIVAQALGNQKLVLDQITALNTTTSGMIERTSRDAARQLACTIQQQAAVGHDRAAPAAGRVRQHLRHDGRDRHLQGPGAGHHGRHDRHPGDRGRPSPATTSTASPQQDQRVAHGSLDLGGRDALPGWAHGRSDVDVDGGRLTVRLQPPSPLSAVAHELAVSSSTWVRRPDG